ncbi:MAG: hypothetical protein WC781_05135 [Candidatus Pacearchaeota archaeon]|jgi:hypothetical protein
MITKEEVYSLNQLMQALVESYQKLESAYNQKDIASFEKIKKFILEIQSKIDAIVK